MRLNFSGRCDRTVGIEWELQLGLEADYIEDEQGTTVSLKYLVEKAIDLVTPVAIELGETDGIRFLRKLIERGPGYRMQRETFAAKGSLREVAQTLAEQFDAGLLAATEAV